MAPFLPRHQLVLVAQTMRQYGGNFMQALSSALLAADPVNADKLLTTFPNILTEYGPSSRFYASVANATYAQATQENARLEKV